MKDLRVDFDVEADKEKEGYDSQDEQSTPTVVSGVCHAGSDVCQLNAWFIYL